jgi:hypothetical protein
MMMAALSAMISRPGEHERRNVRKRVEGEQPLPRRTALI